MLDRLRGPLLLFSFYFLFCFLCLRWRVLVVFLARELYLLWNFFAALELRQLLPSLDLSQLAQLTEGGGSGGLKSGSAIKFISAGA